MYFLSFTPPTCTHLQAIAHEALAYEGWILKHTVTPERCFTRFLDIVSCGAPECVVCSVEMYLVSAFTLNR